MPIPTSVTQAPSRASDQAQLVRSRARLQSSCFAVIKYVVSLISWTSCSLVCVMASFLADSHGWCSTCCLACFGLDVRNQHCLVALGVMLQNHLQSERMTLCKKGMSQSLPARIDITTVWSFGTRSAGFSNVKGMQACVLSCVVLV